MSLGAPSAISERVGARIAARLGTNFFLQHLQTVRDQRSLVDGLILLALFQINYGRLRGEDVRALLEGEGDVAPTPASVNAIAQSLKLPYETVRKRVAALRADGLCELRNGSLLIPPTQLRATRYRWQARVAWSNVRALYLDLADLSVLRPIAPGPEVGSPPLFDVLRLAGEYSLRQFEIMIAVSVNPTLGIMLLNILRASSEHLDGTFTEVCEEGDVIRDDLKRPASVSMVANRCGLTVETARRNIAILVEQGWLHRVAGGGVLARRDKLSAGPSLEARRLNLVHLHRLVEGLNAVGALPFWQP